MKNFIVMLAGALLYWFLPGLYWTLVVLFVAFGLWKYCEMRAYKARLKHRAETTIVEDGGIVFLD